jgi:hypothetical protein
LILSGGWQLSFGVRQLLVQPLNRVAIANKDACDSILPVDVSDPRVRSFLLRRFFCPIAVRVKVVTREVLAGGFFR